MAEPSLGPEELDRLEDALEELELDGALARWSEDELAPQVRARLIDYRSVLAATREALPLEDVPAGVLDGVLAQAQQAAAVAPAAVASVHEPWWSRLRRSFMVPALALAGTAALVLYVFDPADQALLGQAPASAPAPSEESASAARSEAPARHHAAPAATPTAAPVDASMEDADDDADKKVLRSDEPVAEGEAVEAKPDPAAKNEAPAKPTELTAGADAGRGMSSLGDVPGGVQGGAGGASPGPAQTKAGGSAGPASGRWDIVSRGDRARQAGDCVAARDEYALALEDDEASVRARAFAGLGLCDAAAGDEASADANYERARGLDDTIEKYIDSQSERSATKKSRKPPKKSKAQVDAFDPF